MTCSDHPSVSSPCLIVLLIITMLLPLGVFADKNQDSQALSQIRAEIEEGNYNAESDSILQRKLLDLKEKLDAFIAKYEPNKQYVTATTFYANNIAKQSPRVAIELLHQAEEICDEHQFDTLKAFISHDLASIYFQKGLLKEAFSLFAKSAEYFKDVDDKPAYAYALVDMGNVYYRTTDWSFASSYYIKAKSVFEEVSKESDRTWGLSLVYDNLGQVYGQKKSYDTSLYYFKKGLDVRKKGGLVSQYYASYNSIASIYSAMDMLDSAMYYYQKAIDICQEKGLIAELANSYYNISQTYFSIDTTKALRYLYKAVALAKKHSETQLMPMYRVFVDYYQNVNIDSAVFYSEQLYDLAMRFEHSFYQKYATNHAVELYHQLGNDSLESKFLRIQVKQLRASNYEELYKEQLKFEGQKWAQERKQFQIENENQKMISNFKTFIVGLVLIFVVLLLIAWIKLRKTTKKLQSSNKELQELIRNKDLTYSIVAHDLRGPVGASLSLIKLMDEDYMDAETFNGVIPTIRKSMQGTYNLLENLLSWAQLNKKEINLKIEQFDIREAVNEVQRILEESAEVKNIEINNLIEMRQIVTADRNTILTVLRNLISNAIKFTNNAGKISIKSLIENNQIVVSVEDNGRGMDEEILNKLFSEKHILTNPGTDNEKGSGLGLKLCKEFVEMNKGKIWVESTDGKGSIFSFSLPSS